MFQQTRKKSSSSQNCHLRHLHNDYFTFTVEKLNIKCKASERYRRKWKMCNFHSTCTNCQIFFCLKINHLKHLTWMRFPPCLQSLQLWVLTFPLVTFTISIVIIVGECRHQINIQLWALGSQSLVVTFSVCITCNHIWIIEKVPTTPVIFFSVPFSLFRVFSFSFAQHFIMWNSMT